MSSSSRESKSETKVGIIGSAGKKQDAPRMNKQLFENMVQHSKYVIQHEWGLDLHQCTLISGGAAWSDHVAVRLFLEGCVKQLYLHLPCQFEEEKYIDMGERDWRKNPGWLANYIHQAFSDKLECDTLSELKQAIDKGAQVTVSKGFHARNTKIARDSEHLIAFSFGLSNVEPKKNSGTYDTWNKCKGVKIHIPLSKLEFHIIGQKRNRQREEYCDMESEHGTKKRKIQ